MKLTAEQLHDLVGTGKADSRGKNFICPCPKCGENEFSISLDENHRFGCFRAKNCGFKGNIFVLLKHYNKLHEYLHEDQLYSRKEEKLVNRLFVDNQTIDLHLETISPPIGWKQIQTHPYLEGRGFTSYHKWKIGTTLIDPSLRNDYLIFLIEVDKEVKGYIARHIWSKLQIKEYNQQQKEIGSRKKIYRYLNSDTDFSKILGGENELTDKTETVILVEGLFDKDGVDRLLNLDNQEEVKCCCTWKCDISLEQIFKLQQHRKINHIILLYDPDVINKIKQTSLILEDHFQEIEVGFSETGKDPGEMSIEELERVLSTLTNPNNFIVSRLQKKQLQ